MTIRPVPAGAAAVLGVGCLLHVIGLSTNEWVSFQSGSAGFWQTCDEQTCVTIQEDYKPDWWKACEALALLGMIFSFGALLFAGVMVVFDFMGKESAKILVVLTLVGSTVAFVMVIICVIVYGVKAKDLDPEVDFGYSFGLSIAGAALILVGGLVSSYHARH